MNLLKFNGFKNFTSKKFDVFNKQLHELILSMKDLREKNKIL
jgi:hypothetical protein